MLRTFVETLCIANDPKAAIIFAIFSAIKPQIAKNVVEVIDGTITGAWDRASFKGRVPTMV